MCLIWVHAALSVTLVPLEASLVKIKVPYTMGTHELEGRGLYGVVQFDEDAQLITEGNLGIPVSNLKGEKKTLVCHLNESLTLDYKKSDFPEDHVCEEDKLPHGGKNAPAFTEIQANLVKKFPLNSGPIQVSWTIHGVTKEMEVPSTIHWDKQTRRLTITSKFSIDRRDFDITVKKFLFIGVEEKIPLELKLILGEK
jgi:hypothetical protein